MNFGTVTVSDIKTRLRKCKDTGATGLDGWAPRDFKRLPDDILELLCCFYELVESVGVWPFDLTRAAVSLIPKNEGYDPMNMRPISVLPIAYRIWAAVQCKYCTEWQESWITQGQHGCRRGHGTSDALLRLAGELECPFLEGVPIYGVLLDFAKAFDNVPVIITLTLLEKLGMHTRVVKPLCFMYNHLQRYLKIRGFVGSPFHATNGIM